MAKEKELPEYICFASEDRIGEITAELKVDGVYNVGFVLDGDDNGDCIPMSPADIKKLAESVGYRVTRK